MPGFESRNAEDSKVVRHVSSKIDDNELLLMLEHGQDGVAAEIRDKDGELRLRQDVEDTQFVRCACLMKLQPQSSTGWLTVHINNGRSVKGLLGKGLTKRFRDQFPYLILEINPFVMDSVLRRAIQENRIEKVKLVKLEQPNDRSMSGTDKWVPSGVAGKIELIVMARGRLQRVAPELLLRYLGSSDKQSAFNEIVEFQGLTFDQASVVVTVGSGHRTFNIERPEAGHPITEDIEAHLQLVAGEPTDDSLFDALRQALSTVGS